MKLIFKYQSKIMYTTSKQNNTTRYTIVIIIDFRVSKLNV